MQRRFGMDSINSSPLSDHFERIDLATVGAMGGLTRNGFVRGAATTASAAWGGVNGLFGFVNPINDVHAALVGANNVTKSVENNKPWGLDAGMAMLSLVPGVGAIGGAYTTGKATWNANAFTESR
jgi:hypothetical protein